MKKLFTLIVLLATVCVAQAEDLTWWGNYTDQSTGLAGNYKLGTYEAAMFVSGDGALAGASIEAFRAQTRLYSNAKNFKFWIRATLNGENLAEAVPETLSSSNATMTTATLAEAYAVPAEGIYVGYTFELASWLSDYDYTPVVYAKASFEKGFYLKQPDETEFTDKSSTGCLAMQVGFKAPEVKAWWGYYTGNEQTGLQGNNKVPGSYQAATFVPGDGDLKGTKISAIRIQTRLYSAVTADAKFWIRSALDGENLVEKEFTPSMSSATVELDNAFELPETGAYVGYSFRITGWYEGSYEGNPVVYAKKSIPQSFYIMQPEETEFSDLSSKGCLPVQIEISGGSMAANSVQVADDLDDMVAVLGEPIFLRLNLTSQGTAGVQSIDFTYTLDGATKQGHADLATPIDAMLGAKGTATVELEAPTAAGQQEIEIQITKVNGADNATTGRKSKCSVIVTVLSESAPRKAVAEIFYNATNGYAPRAIVGADLLSQEENVIAFLIDHYSGKQAVASYADFQKIPNATSFTNKYSAYPIAEVNRAFTEDPYTGLVKAANSGVVNHFGAAEPVKATLAAATPASVSLTAEWANEEKTSIVMNATANFMADFKTAPYRLAFVVIKDNVKETILNYIYYYKTAYADDDMAEWRDNPYNNADYPLNNVAVASSDVNGIIGSLPTKNIVAGQDYAYEYTQELDEVEGQEEADNARAIVLLINKDTKEIVNADMVRVLTHDEATGIKAIAPTTSTAGNCVYNLNGQRVQQARHGLYIVNGKKVVR